MQNYDYIDFNQKYNYVIQWLEESDFARCEYHYWLWRASLAKLGKPCKNLYQEELESNINKIEDAVLKAKYSKCISVPAGTSFALKKALDNRANQMASGVDTYEYQVNDPYMIINDETEDLLAAKCEQDYIENKLNVLASTVSTDLTKYGLFAAIVDYNPITDKNNV